MKQVHKISFQFNSGFADVVTSSILLENLNLDCIDFCVEFSCWNLSLSAQFEPIETLNDILPPPRKGASTVSFPARNPPFPSRVNKFINICGRYLPTPNHRTVFDCSWKTKLQIMLYICVDSCRWQQISSVFIDIFSAPGRSLGEGARLWTTIQCATTASLGVLCLSTASCWF